VRQPWAELIVSGNKPIEIRRWETGYRGRIWIHAPQHLDEALDQKFGLRNLFRGGYVGSAELTSVERIDERRWEAWRGQHLDPGHFQPDLYAWVLAYPRRLRQPVAGPGALGLFRVPEEILDKLTEADQAASSC